MAIDPQSEFLALDPLRSMQPNQSELVVIPYVEIGGARTLPDSFLEAVYLQMVEDGSDKTVFNMGSVKSKEQFIAMMKNPANLPVFVLNGQNCAMVAWLNTINHNNACGHFCSFYTGIPPVEVGKKVLEYWWSLQAGGRGLEVILGIVPAFNERAIAFVKKLGFIEAGRVPRLFLDTNGKQCDSVICYLER